MKNRRLKSILKILGIIFALLILATCSYVAYMQIKYYRIEDNLALEIKNNPTKILKPHTKYTALTYNIGFGAYDQEFSFFMDKGKMADGTPVVGKHSRAVSKEHTLNNTNGSKALVKKLSADYILLQEVDVKATRSYGINQKEEFENYFPTYGSVFALNFHAPYMIYPFTEPHGSVQAGLLTLSNHSIESATRISYPVDTGFFTKFFELDRCFTITRSKVSNGKELVLINSHMSAYDKGGTMRAKQIKLLNDTMETEYKKGNYVIVSGDFNHALGGTVGIFPTKQMLPEWVFELTNEDLTTGMSIIQAKNYKKVPTCRSCDIPYTKGVNYTSILDGFIVSDNITATVQNIDANFMYSDHNPVKLTFILN